MGGKGICVYGDNSGKLKNTDTKEKRQVIQLLDTFIEKEQLKQRA